MSKLIQVYSNAAGLRIREPFMMEKFFPLTEKMYFTIQGGSGQEAKCYDYYAEALEIIAPFIGSNNISIIQLGAKEDRPIPGCRHLMGATSLAQAYYILRRAFLHIGNDSWLMHAAGALKKPCIGLYGSTSSWNHGPYFQSPHQTILIDSHRCGRKPSYSAEQAKTVNLIPPEDVANAILRLCGIVQKVPQETMLMGQFYKMPLIELVPNFVSDPRIYEQLPFTVRMDYHFDEDILARTLASGRKVSIVTNKPIRIELLNHFKANIIGIAFEIGIDDEPSYLAQLKQTGIKLKIVVKQKEDDFISDIRAKFFDVHPAIEKVNLLTRDKFIEESSTYRNSPVDKESDLSKLFYRSVKFLLSEGKIFGSKAAWLENRPLQSFEQNVQQVIDRPEFWEEFPHFRIFKQFTNATPT